MPRSSQRVHPPIHPGEILLEEFMKPNDISQNGLARSLGVNPARVSDIVRGRRGISGDTALRLSRFFGTTPEFWMNLQAHFELQSAEDAAGAEIAATVRPHAA